MKSYDRPENPISKPPLITFVTSVFKSSSILLLPSG
jgi:hypothetical protein